MRGCRSSGSHTQMRRPGVPPGPLPGGLGVLTRGLARVGTWLPSLPPLGPVTSLQVSPPRKPVSQGGPSLWPSRPSGLLCGSCLPFSLRGEGARLDHGCPSWQLLQGARARCWEARPLPRVALTSSQAGVGGAPAGDAGPALRHAALGSPRRAAHLRAHPPGPHLVLLG